VRSSGHGGALEQRSILDREIQEALPKTYKPAYTTVQKLVYRLEAKRAVRRAKKIGGAPVFEAWFPVMRRTRRFIDEFIRISLRPCAAVMSHLIESGRLTLDDIDEARKTLKEADEKRSRGVN